MKHLDELQNLNDLIGQVSSRSLIDSLPVDGAAEVMAQVGLGLRRLQGVQVAEVFGRDVRRTEIRATGLDENALALARRARSNVRVGSGDGGMELLIADLDPERHAIVLNAIDALVDETWRNQHARIGDTAGIPSSPIPSSTLLTPSTSYVPSPSSRSRRGEAKVIVRIDYETLRSGVRAANSLSELDGGTDLEHMILLCSLHHHLVHEGGRNIIRNRDGTVSVTRRPDYLALTA